MMGVGDVVGPVLELRGIQKSFDGVKALRNGVLELRRGEVHALLGENGAGKSTLIKVLGGAHLPDGGEMFLEGREVRFESPLESRRAGVAVIWQELQLVPGLSVRENLFLGRERAWAGWIDGREELGMARVLFGELGLEIDPARRCGELTIAEQQLVEIARALSLDARILVMDEPTAALSAREVDRLFGMVRRLRERGVGVVYVSHRLDEVFELCDRATVLRDGEHVTTVEVGELSRERLIELMVGRRLESEFPPRSGVVGRVRLEVKNLAGGERVRGVSLHVCAGEIVGLAGLVGAGRTETARLIFGADEAEGGEVWVDGRRMRGGCPREAIGAGVCLLTEDRKGQGLVLGLPVLENFSLPNLGLFSWMGFVRGGEEASAFGAHAVRMRIKAADAGMPVRYLSGGNQQKVVLAKWLEANAGVVIFDEPTRGVDVGAKLEIYELMRALAAAGKAVLMISSELPEVLGMSDRVVVMRGGRVSGEIAEPGGSTQEAVLGLAMEGGV